MYKSEVSSVFQTQPVSVFHRYGVRCLKSVENVKNTQQHTYRVRLASGVH